MNTIEAVETAMQELVEKYDANKNGKIDVPERRSYIRERGVLRKRLARLESRRHRGLPPQVLRYLEPTVWTEAKFKRYDANGNGKLETSERRKERDDAIQAVLAKLREQDRIDSE